MAARAKRAAGRHGEHLVEERNAMTKANSTDTSRPRKPRNPDKPEKPRKDYPLYAHANGQWAKKVRGKTHFFGEWAKPQEAIDNWLADKDALLAGRVPRRRLHSDSPTLEDLVNKFLTTKRTLYESGERSPHTINLYVDICNELLAAFGAKRLLVDILPEDFELLRARWAKRWGPTRLRSEINRARVVFNYAYKNRLIPAPMLYGEGFVRPSKKAIRQQRHKRGERLFEPAELRAMIKSASQPLKAMLLLGVNCALGNEDIGGLTFASIDLAAGWLTYPRGKTGIRRRIPLWPETVRAIREWVKMRPAPKDPADFQAVFITVRGNRWNKGTDNRAISHECRKLLDRLGIRGRRNFYDLRHVVQTIGEEVSRDLVAVKAIMGHAVGDISSEYRERVSDDRLREVVDKIHDWLFVPAKKKIAGKPKLKIADEAAATA
jgi:integrase